MLKLFTFVCFSFTNLMSTSCAQNAGQLRVNGVKSNETNSLEEKKDGTTPVSPVTPVVLNTPAQADSSAVKNLPTVVFESKNQDKKPTEPMSAKFAASNVTAAKPRDSHSDVMDFLIQDVCVDQNGKVEAKDPAMCAVESRRDVLENETVPYVKTDMGPGYDKSASEGWQRSDSFPLSYDGKTYVIKSFDFGGPRMPGKMWGKFEDFQDGFDVTEIQGDFASYIMTKDGGNDNYWTGKNCAMDDGWVLFPLKLNPGQQGSVLHDIYQVGMRELCQLSSRNEATAAWHRLPGKVTYSGGQSLETITTHHWSHASVSNSTSFEQNYYTREYGGTRWEAWKKCEDNQECTPNVSANECNGDKKTIINGSAWKRDGCRDWTSIKVEKRDFPIEWANLVKYRVCLNANGSFGDGKTCQ